MPEETPNSNSNASQLRSGPEIVADFVSTLKGDSQLDASTVEAIESLFQDKRLTSTNLLRLLEDARGKTSV
jgi:hypothetical protein